MARFQFDYNILEGQRFWTRPRRPCFDKRFAVLPIAAMEDDFYSNPQKMFASLAAANPNLPIPSLPSYAAVKREAAERSINIFANWNRLHQILERHEVVIRKKWMKKSKHQREKVLLLTWPWYGDYSSSRHPRPQNRVRTSTSTQHSLPRRVSVPLYQPGRFDEGQKFATPAPRSRTHDARRLRLLRP